MLKNLFLTVFFLFSAGLVNAEDMTIIVAGKATKELKSISSTDKMLYVYTASVGEKFQHPINIDEDVLAHWLFDFFPNMKSGDPFYIIISDESKPELLETTCESIGRGRSIGIYFKKGD